MTLALHRVLIIDDEPTVARSIARQLAGLEVAVCGNGIDALAALESDRRFDLILCDLVMPGMSGVELHAALARARPDRLDRILFITGGAITAGAERFLADPAIRYLLKPFTPGELMRAIGELLAAAAPLRAA